jgi:hypothetical protein
MTVADLVAESLALDDAALRERIVSLEEDAGVYRWIAVVALDALHLLTRRHDRLRDECDRLRHELRWFREERLLKVGADEDEAP